MELPVKLLGNGVVEPSFDVVGVMEYCLAEIFVEVQVDKAAVSSTKNVFVLCQSI